MCSCHCISPAFDVNAAVFIPPPLLLHQIKLDMEMRGTILLRNKADDTVAVLQTERLEQVR
jgi:hypothetical protein